MLRVCRPKNIFRSLRVHQGYGHSAGSSLIPSALLRLKSTKVAHDNRTEVHGGDDIHRVDRLQCDFSVTTNALGPVPGALQDTQRLLDVQLSITSAAGGNVKALLEDGGIDIAHSPAVEHYPQRFEEDLYKTTSDFMAGADAELSSKFQDSILFGNGASELIDLIARTAPPGPFCVSPMVPVQYKEYERACKNAGREQISDPKAASVISLVNPNNPTGFFFERAEMEKWIEENAHPGAWVFVDESMLFWRGPSWRDSGVSRSFVEKMAENYINIFLIYSWTKIFSCTGLRIGSVICPNAKVRKRLEGYQVPWSVTAFAQTYLKGAMRDTKYLEKTWELTPKWRKDALDQLQRLYPNWKFHGEPWLSWIWIDTGDENVAFRLYEACLEIGCPIRHAKAGYGLPTIIRIAVRRPTDFSILYQALVRLRHGAEGRVSFGTYADIHPSVIDRVDLVHIDDIKPHELVINERAEKLQSYIADLPVKTLPSIILDSKFNVLIDGHHRLELFRALGLTVVPAVFITYDHEDVLVNPPGVGPGTTKEEVIGSALRGEVMAPKSTQHVVRSRGGTLMPIIVLAPQIAEVLASEE